jgi:hypothetical protein
MEDAPRAAVRPACRRAQFMMKEERHMKKTICKLHLSRETLRQLLDPSALRAAPGGNSVPVTACGFTCPPICTRARPCAG